jgi:energy-coupling factor transport system permease protein
MFQRLWLASVAQPLHPLLSVACAAVALTFGLLLRDATTLLTFVAGLGLIFMMVGYGVLLARIARIVIPLAALIGVLAALFGGGVSGGLMTFGSISLLGLTIAFAWTIDPTQLARALRQAGAPPLVALSLLITVRSIPTLVGEAVRIRDAMRVRGLSLRHTPLRILYRALVVPLLIRVLTLSESLALALETRAFTGDPCATIYRPVALHGRDYATLALMVILMSGVAGTQWLFN